MHQGPSQLTQAQQDMQALLHSIRENVAELEQYFVRNASNELIEPATTQSLVHYLRTEAGKRKISLNEKQALLIRQQKTATVDQVMALQTKPLDPNKTIALRMAVAVVIATMSPDLAGKGISLDLTQKILHHLLDNKLGAYTNLVDLMCGMDIIAGQYTGYSIRNLGGTAASYAFEHYGKLGYIALPLAILLYSKGPGLLKQMNDSAFMEAGGDLIDMMGGIADDETYEKYRGSLATMPIEDVASKVTGSVNSTLSWLWNKLPAMRSQTPVQAIDAAPERALPRLN